MGVNDDIGNDDESLVQCSLGSASAQLSFKSLYSVSFLYSPIRVNNRIMMYSKTENPTNIRIIGMCTHRILSEDFVDSS